MGAEYGTKNHARGENFYFLIFEDEEGPEGVAAACSIRDQHNLGYSLMNL